MYFLVRFQKSTLQKNCTDWGTEQPYHKLNVQKKGEAT
jgi:hypothetical protein